MILLKKIYSNIHEHDRALVMVIIGVGLTLLQMLGLFYLFNDHYIDSRAIINTMNISAPLLCMGFDITSPQITKSEKSALFIWNFVLLHLFLALVFFLASFLISDVKTSYIFLGLVLGAIFSSNLLLNEYERNINSVKKYFFDLHVRDRFNRTFFILVIAFIADSIFTWSTILIVLSLAYLFFLIIKYKEDIGFNFLKLKKHLTLSWPFLLTSLVIVFVYRATFYFSYYFDTSTYAAKIDFWLTISLLLLIPMMNVSKFAETSAQGDMNKYIYSLKSGWTKLYQQQLLIILMIFILTALGIYFNKITSIEIITMILPLSLSILLLTLTPSYLYLALLKNKFSSCLHHVFLFIIISLIIFLFKAIYLFLPVSWLLLINCFLYLIYTLHFSRASLDVKISVILRFNDGLKLLCIFILCHSVLFLGAYFAGI